MRNSTNRVWPEALRARRFPDLFLPDAFQAHARIDDRDRLPHEPHARQRPGNSVGEAHRVETRAGEHQVALREAQNERVALVTTDRELDGLANWSKGSCSARALVNPRAAEVKSLV